MFTILILILSLFYYIAKGLAPTVVTGANLYPPLLILALVALARNAFVRGTLMRPQLHQLGLLLGIAACILFLHVLFLDPNMKRFDQSLSLYFGVFVFAFLFCSLQPPSEAQMKMVITASLVLLSLESAFEMLIFHVFKNIDLIARMAYVEGAHYTAVYDPTSTNIIRPVGLLQWASNTSSYVVFLSWLYYAFNARPKIKLAHLALIAGPCFFISFSGMGFIVLFFTLLMFMKPLARTVFIFFVPLFFFGINLAADFYPILKKASISYLWYVYEAEGTLMGNKFIEFIWERPSFVVFGMPGAELGSIFAGLYFLKSFVDFGLTPILLHLYLFYVIFKNFKYSGASPVMLKGIKLAFLSLIIGTFHYNLLFAVPTQAMLGALLAYSFRLSPVARRA